MNVFNMPPMQDDGVFGFIVLIFVYLAIIGSSRKKRRERKGAREERRSARAQRRQSAGRAPQQTRAQSAPQRKPMQTQLEMDLQAAGEGDDPCHEDMMHRELRPSRPGVRFKSVTQEQMRAAGEGEDPCHGWEPSHGLEPSHGWESSRDEMPALSAQEHSGDSPVYDSPIYGAADRGELARQVLSGVVMSEVLKRPAERALERKMRRRA